MSRVWIPVSPVQARGHPLYGRGGWLAWFALVVLLMLGSSAGFWTLLLTGRTATDATARFIGVYAAISAFAALVIMILFAARSPNFRIAAIGLLLVPWPTVAIVFYRTVPPYVIAAGSVLWLSLALVWVTYLQLSRRVRITFEHCIAENEREHRAEPTYMPLPTTRAYEGGPQQRFDIPDFRTRLQRSPAEECWAEALQEYESGLRKPGTWARAYAEAGGQESAAKAIYLQLRSSQIYEENRRESREDGQEDGQEDSRDENQSAYPNQNASPSGFYDDGDDVDTEFEYELSLTEHESKIARAIEDLEAAGEGGLNDAVHLLHLLGGEVDRRPPRLFASPAWHVEFAGRQSWFDDDSELLGWVVNVVMPKARQLLPPRPDSRR